MSSKQLFAGIDIGATKLHAIVADEAGKILGAARRKTKRELGFAGVVGRAADTVLRACGAAGVAVDALAAVGVGAPSPILPDGTAVHAPNLDWKNVPLTRKLRAALGPPVHAANDCDAGTFGEHVFGAGQRADPLVGLFMGTGLGGGLVIDGQIVNGANHKAAEMGHMVVVVNGRRCGCGHRGCLEAYASKTGMARRLAHEVQCVGRSTTLVGKDGKLAELSGSVLAAAYAAGDALAVETLHEAADFLGYGVGNLITLLGPQVVVLGGGVIEALGEKLIKRVRRAAREVTWPPTSFADTSIRIAALGDDAVALGAVAWARRQLARE